MRSTIFLLLTIHRYDFILPLYFPGDVLMYPYTLVQKPSRLGFSNKALKTFHKFSQFHYIQIEKNVNGKNYVDMKPPNHKTTLLPFASTLSTHPNTFNTHPNSSFNNCFNPTMVSNLRFNRTVVSSSGLNKTVV